MRIENVPQTPLDFNDDDYFFLTEYIGLFYAKLQNIFVI